MLTPLSAFRLVAFVTLLVAPLVAGAQCMRGFGGPLCKDVVGCTSDSQCDNGGTCEILDPNKPQDSYCKGCFAGIVLLLPDGTTQRQPGFRGAFCEISNADGASFTLTARYTPKIQQTQRQLLASTSNVGISSTSLTAREVCDCGIDFGTFAPSVVAFGQTSSDSSYLMLTGNYERHTSSRQTALLATTGFDARDTAHKAVLWRVVGSLDQANYLCSVDFYCSGFYLFQDPSQMTSFGSVAFYTNVLTQSGPTFYKALSRLLPSSASVTRYRVDRLSPRQSCTDTTLNTGYYARTYARGIQSSISGLTVGNIDVPQSTSLDVQAELHWRLFGHIAQSRPSPTCDMTLVVDQDVAYCNATLAVQPYVRSTILNETCAPISLVPATHFFGARPEAVQTGVLFNNTCSCIMPFRSSQLDVSYSGLSLDQVADAQTDCADDMCSDGHGVVNTTWFLLADITTAASPLACICDALWTTSSVCVNSGYCNWCQQSMCHPENGGIVQIDADGSSHCDCPSIFKGDRCEINLCNLNNTYAFDYNFADGRIDNATGLHQKRTDAICQCRPGFYGITCDFKCTNGDFDVATNTCICNHRQGFRGAACDEPICEPHHSHYQVSVLYTQEQNTQYVSVPTYVRNQSCVDNATAVYNSTLQNCTDSNRIACNSSSCQDCQSVNGTMCQANATLAECASLSDFVDSMCPLALVFDIQYNSSYTDAEVGFCLCVSPIFYGPECRQSTCDTNAINATAGWNGYRPFGNPVQSTFDNTWYCECNFPYASSGTLANGTGGHALECGSDICGYGTPSATSDNTTLATDMCTCLTTGANIGIYSPPSLCTGRSVAECPNPCAYGHCRIDVSDKAFGPQFIGGPKSNPCCYCSASVAFGVNATDGCQPFCSFYQPCLTAAHSGFLYNESTNTFECACNPQYSSVNEAGNDCSIFTPYGNATTSKKPALATSKGFVLSLGISIGTFFLVIILSSLYYAGVLCKHRRTKSFLGYSPLFSKYSVAVLTISAVLTPAYAQNFFYFAEENCYDYTMGQSAYIRTMDGLLGRFDLGYSYYPTYTDQLRTKDNYYTQTGLYTEPDKRIVPKDPVRVKNFTDFIGTLGPETISWTCTTPFCNGVIAPPNMMCGNSDNFNTFSNPCPRFMECYGQGFSDNCNYLPSAATGFSSQYEWYCTDQRNNCVLSANRVYPYSLLPWKFEDCRTTSPGSNPYQVSLPTQTCSGHSYDFVRYADELNCDSLGIPLSKCPNARESDDLHRKYVVKLLFSPLPKDNNYKMCCCRLHNHDCGFVGPSLFNLNSHDFKDGLTIPNCPTYRTLPGHLFDIDCKAPEYLYADYRTGGVFYPDTANFESIREFLDPLLIQAGTDGIEHYVTGGFSFKSVAPSAYLENADYEYDFGIPKCNCDRGYVGPQCHIQTCTYQPYVANYNVVTVTLTDDLIHSVFVNSTQTDFFVQHSDFEFNPLPLHPGFTTATGGIQCSGNWNARLSNGNGNTNIATICKDDPALINFKYDQDQVNWGRCTQCADGWGLIPGIASQDLDNTPYHSYNQGLCKKQTFHDSAGKVCGGYGDATGSKLVLVDTLNRGGDDLNMFGRDFRRSNKTAITGCQCFPPYSKPYMSPIEGNTSHTRDSGICIRTCAESFDIHVVLQFQTNGVYEGVPTVVSNSCGGITNGLCRPIANGDGSGLNSACMCNAGWNGFDCRTRDDRFFDSGGPIARVDGSVGFYANTNRPLDSLSAVQRDTYNASNLCGRNSYKRSVLRRLTPSQQERCTREGPSSVSCYLDFVYFHNEIVPMHGSEMGSTTKYTAYQCECNEDGVARGYDTNNAKGTCSRGCNAYELQGYAKDDPTRLQSCSGSRQGTCTSDPFNLTVSTFCVCKAGWGNTNCDTPILTDLLGQVCGGTDRGVVVFNTFTFPPEQACICLYGYVLSSSGLCRTQYDSGLDCPSLTSSVCSGAGSCEPSVYTGNDFACVCNPGHEGLDCYATTVPTFVGDSGSFYACSNRGYGDASGQCICLPGYVGFACEFDVANRPCGHGQPYRNNALAGITIRSSTLAPRVDDSNIVFVPCGIFDPIAYAMRYPLDAAFYQSERLHDPVSPDQLLSWVHYSTVGYYKQNVMFLRILASGRITAGASGLFDAAAYATNNAFAEADAWNQYRTIGHDAQYQACVPVLGPLVATGQWSSAGYLRLYPDVASVEILNIHGPLSNGFLGIFDLVYAMQNDPWLHYVRIGYGEGRHMALVGGAHGVFSPADYAKLHVITSGTDPWLSYNVDGRPQLLDAAIIITENGRDWTNAVGLFNDSAWAQAYASRNFQTANQTIFDSFSSHVDQSSFILDGGGTGVFDANAYYAAYQDQLGSYAAGQELESYLHYGRSVGLNATLAKSVAYGVWNSADYLAMYPDVANMDAWDHYSKYGHQEGRQMTLRTQLGASVSGVFAPEPFLQSYPWMQSLRIRDAFSIYQRWGHPNQRLASVFVHSEKTCDTNFYGPTCQPCRPREKVRTCFGSYYESGFYYFGPHCSPDDKFLANIDLPDRLRCHDGYYGTGDYVCNENYVHGNEVTVVDNGFSYRTDLPCSSCRPGQYGLTCQHSCLMGPHILCADGMFGTGAITCEANFVSVNGGQCNECAPNHCGGDCTLCVDPSLIVSDGVIVIQGIGASHYKFACTNPLREPRLTGQFVTCENCLGPKKNITVDGVNHECGGCLYSVLRAPACIDLCSLAGGGCNPLTGVIVCRPMFYGPYCSRCPVNDNGLHSQVLCDDGATGTGAIYCSAGYLLTNTDTFGSYIDPSQPSHPVVQYEVRGSNCDDCLPNHFSASCLPCPAYNNQTQSCDDGLAGTGLIRCRAGYADGKKGPCTVCDAAQSDEYCFGINVAKECREGSVAGTQYTLRCRPIVNLFLRASTFAIAGLSQFNGDALGIVPTMNVLEPSCQNASLEFSWNVVNSLDLGVYQTSIADSINDRQSSSGVREGEAFSTPLQNGHTYTIFFQNALLYAYGRINVQYACGANNVCPTAIAGTGCSQCSDGYRLDAYSNRCVTDVQFTFNNALVQDQSRLDSLSRVGDYLVSINMCSDQTLDFAYNEIAWTSDHVSPLVIPAFLRTTYQRYQLTFVSKTMTQRRSFDLVYHCVVCAKGYAIPNVNSSVLTTIDSSVNECTICDVGYIQIDDGGFKCVPFETCAPGYFKFNGTAVGRTSTQAQMCAPKLTLNITTAGQCTISGLDAFDGDGRPILPLRLNVTDVDCFDKTLTIDFSYSIFDPTLIFSADSGNSRGPMNVFDGQIVDVQFGSQENSTYTVHTRLLITYTCAKSQGVVFRITSSPDPILQPLFTSNATIAFSSDLCATQTLDARVLPSDAYALVSPSTLDKYNNHTSVVFSGPQGNVVFQIQYSCSRVACPDGFTPSHLLCSSCTVGYQCPLGHCAAPVPDTDCEACSAGFTPQNGTCVAGASLAVRSYRCRSGYNCDMSPQSKAVVYFAPNPSNAFLLELFTSPCQQFPIFFEVNPAFALPHPDDRQLDSRNVFYPASANVSIRIGHTRLDYTLQSTCLTCPVGYTALSASQGCTLCDVGYVQNGTACTLFVPDCEAGYIKVNGTCAPSLSISFVFPPDVLPVQNEYNPQRYDIVMPSCSQINLTISWSDASTASTIAGQFRYDVGGLKPFPINTVEAVYLLGMRVVVVAFTDSVSLLPVSYAFRRYSMECAAAYCPRILNGSNCIQCSPNMVEDTSQNGRYCICAPQYQFNSDFSLCVPSPCGVGYEGTQPHCVPTLFLAITSDAGYPLESMRSFNGSLEAGTFSAVLGFRSCAQTNLSLLWAMNRTIDNQAFYAEAFVNSGSLTSFPFDMHTITQIRPPKDSRLIIFFNYANGTRAYSVSLFIACTPCPASYTTNDDGSCTPPSCEVGFYGSPCSPLLDFSVTSTASDFQSGKTAGSLTFSGDTSQGDNYNIYSVVERGCYQTNYIVAHWPNSPAYFSVKAQYYTAQTNATANALLSIGETYFNPASLDVITLFFYRAQDQQQTAIVYSVQINYACGEKYDYPQRKYCPFAAGQTGCTLDQYYSQH